LVDFFEGHFDEPFFAAFFVIIFAPSFFGRGASSGGSRRIVVSARL
jgi:hypothetical protein